MKSLRTSRIVVAIIVLFVLWLGLGFYQQSRHASWAESSYFYVSIVRVFLMAGVVICVLAAVLATFKNRETSAGDKPSSGAGWVVAVLIAAISACVAGLGAADAAFGPGGSGEWAGLGDMMVLMICIPGALGALAMAVFLKTMGPVARIVCILLVLAAVGLAYCTPKLREERRQRRVEQFMNPDAMQKQIRELKEKQAGDH